jgi:ribosomal protein S12 methylthiotransferase accessory factor
MSKLRLSPSSTVTPTAAGVVLRSDLGVFQLEGPDVRVFLTRLLPLLDGSRDLETLAGALPDYSRASVEGLLGLLQQKGLLEGVPEEEGAAAAGWQAQERFFRGWNLPPQAGLERLRRARVLVAGLEPWGAVAACELAASGIGALHLLDDLAVTADDLLAVRVLGRAQLGRLRREALRDAIAAIAPQCNVSVGPLAPVAPGGDRSAPDAVAAAAGAGEGAPDLAPAGGPWDLLLTGLTADDLFLLQRLARFAHGAGLRSVYAHLDGLEAWIGPGVVPGETACWNCFRLRRLTNSDFVRTAHEIDTSLAAAPAERRARSYLAPMAPLAGHSLAMEVLKLLAGFTAPRLFGRLLVQNLITAESTWHSIVRMPWCELCGGAAAAGPPAAPGGLVLPGNDPGGDGGPGAGTGGEPSAGEGEDLSSGATRAGGLGQVADEAALRELLAGWVDERVGVIRSLHSGRVQAGDAAALDLPVAGTAVLGSYTEGWLRPVQDPQVASGKGLSALDALIGAAGEAIERYSAARYRKVDLPCVAWRDLAEESFDPRRLCLYDDTQYRRPGFPFAPFDPGLPIHWVRGTWFDDGGPVWLPALPVFFNFEAPPAAFFCQVSSNGLAAGADRSDAALRAVYELIERDAFMVTWLCQLPGRRIDPRGALEPALAEVVRQLAEHGAAVELYLLDAGTGVPTVLCLGLGDGDRWPAATAALATHLDARVAARKAVLEQAHVGTYLARLMRSATVPASPAEVLTLDDHALYYVPAARLPLLDFLRAAPGDAVQLADLPRFAGAAQEAAAVCAERLRQAGLRVAIADVTAPDVARSPFRVARALGTDMQPIHFGEHLRRLANPRLTPLAGERGINPNPHPVA